MYSNPKIIGAMFVVMTLLGTGCSRAPTTTPGVSPAAANAPAWSLKDYSGKTVSSADFKGTPLVINSWAAWCPFCKKELPDFAAIQSEFKGRVTFIAIDRAESRGTAKEFTDRLGVSDKMIFLLDPDDSFYRSIGGFSMPETIFVDKNGFIREHRRGSLTADDARGLVRSLLEENGGVSPAASGAAEGDSEAVVGSRINFTGSAFHPRSVRIKRGQAVTFVNESSKPVRIISTAFDSSKELRSEETHTATLGIAGTVTYTNALDPQEASGEIIVE